MRSFRLLFAGFPRGDEICFDWDETTGTFSGPDAANVESMVSYAMQQGRVTSHPWPTGYEIRDARTNAGELAAVLSAHYLLDPFLREEFIKRYPQPKRRERKPPPDCIVLY